MRARWSAEQAAVSRIVPARQRPWQDGCRSRCANPGLAAVAAAVALRAPAVVPAQVPVLRLQFARGARRQAAASAPTSTRWCADLEAALPLVWGRRVHSIFIGGGTPSLFSPEAIDRLLGRRARAPAARARRRDHAGGQSRHLRARPLPRLSRRRRHAPVDRRAELRRRAAAGARPRPRRARRRSAAVEAARRDLRHLQPRPDVRAAGADARRSWRGGHRRRRSRFEPPHLSVYHLTIEPNTLLRAAFRRSCRTTTWRPTMLDRVEAQLGAARASSTTRSRPTRGPATAARTTSTTGSSATTSASAPARTASSASPTASCARCAFANPRRYMEAPLPATRSRSTGCRAAATCRSSSC